ncbi:uncharacterized protein TRUGW13939_00783 [Talaromyces rugulosus]|uniref:Uncharacterized protein n=1 Tax=Talaromyces rugulosus TaxID=121627 RepID=A0A7H8QKB5_TALRU|nr:uncharacterized protein TRUGW13939_00783 [Talaromyces rugulosus]QKX53703.1 hypothetical protein TRUGW13939_00783 [Talaromyces rugulosus]
MNTNQPILSRKRQHSEQPLASPEQARKKQGVDHLSDSQPPAASWDDLSQIGLTRNALPELDRRNNQAPASLRQSIQLLKPITGKELHPVPQRFSRQGGPDLSDLRGV